MPFIHYDEAKRLAIESAIGWLKDHRDVERLLLVFDLFGKLRVVLRAPQGSVEGAVTQLAPDLEARCGTWWTGEVLSVAAAGETERQIWDQAWDTARADSDGDQRIRVLHRHRTRNAWFSDSENPQWRAVEDGPPIIVFYSFKGGLGRSTALASLAIQRARAGERVCVVDFDLDAPGIGRLLSADEKGITSPWGIVDYLVERPTGNVPLSDYHHSCSRVAGSGEIITFPAGMIDLNYADKLARADLEEPPSASDLGITRLLSDIRLAIKPDWIFLDARTGVSEPAGLLLSGLAHLHVLFGTTSEQSWQGLKVVIDRLGRRRVVAGQPQGEILLVQTMIPPTPEAAERAKTNFAERARQEFTDSYYAMESDDPTDNRFWDMRDVESADAPHVPVTISYDPRLADFRDITDIADVLCEGVYTAVSGRVAARFVKEIES